MGKKESKTKPKISSNRLAAALSKGVKAKLKMYGPPAALPTKLVKQATSIKTQ